MFVIGVYWLDHLQFDGICPEHNSIGTTSIMDFDGDGDDDGIDILAGQVVRGSSWSLEERKPDVGRIISLRNVRISQSVLVSAGGVS